ncbi:MAG: VanZ family protein [Gemmatimonadota bacterium]
MTRERLLWLCTALAVGGVYSTLYTASMFSDVLYHAGVVTVLFLTAMVLSGVVVLTEGWKVRPRGFEVGVALGIFVIYLMVFLRLAIPERSHLIEYGVIGVLLYESLHESKRAGRRVPVPALTAAVLATLIGVIDEVVQIFLPFRHFDWVDVLFNFMAACGAIDAMLVLRWARRRAEARAEVRG